MDNSAIKGFDTKGEQGFVYTKLDAAINWVRANSVWPQPMGLACCAIELMAVGGSRFDIGRFGMEVMRFSPRQADCVDAILIQAPLPKHLSERDTFNRVRPDKDVDGFSSANLGLLCQEDPRAFTACTPAGIMELLKRYEVPTAGKRVVVIGRSIIVGKPMALLLMKKGADATVTVCHSKSENLKQICAQADIIIAAVGKPMTVTADMVKEGACVIDVGINRIPSEKTKSGYRLVGDVDFENVAPKCSKITPVPGGVGPMTVAMLMSNTVAAYMRHI